MRYFVVLGLAALVACSGDSSDDAPVDETPAPGMPVAVDDSYVVVANATLTVAANDSVLANDSDPEGASLTAALGTTTIANGTLTFASDGTFTYVPAEGFSGLDGFAYVASAGERRSAEAVVTIHVEPVPLAVDDVIGAVQGRAKIIHVLANDSTAREGATLAIASVTQPAHGAVVVNGDVIELTPSAELLGDDSFTYTITDGVASSAPATVSLTLYDRPQAMPDALTMQQGSTLVVPSSAILSNDIDGGAPLRVAFLAQTPTGTIDYSSGTRELSYTPPPDYYGTVQVYYGASDGVQTSTDAILTITIVPPATTTNRAPMAPLRDYSFDAPTLVVSLLDGVTDADGDTLSVIPQNRVIGSSSLTIEQDGTLMFVHAYSGPTTYEGIYAVTDGKTTVYAKFYLRFR